MLETEAIEPTRVLELYRNNRRKWFVVLDGPIKERIKALSAHEHLTNMSASTLATVYGARSFYRDSNGIVRGLVFNDKVHPEFKHKNKFGYSLPKPGSKAEGAIAALPTTEQISIELLSVLGPINAFPFDITYEDGKRDFRTAVMVPGEGVPAFDYTVGKGVYCMYLPDNRAAADDLTKRFSNITVPEFETPDLTPFGLLQVPYLTYKSLLKYDWTVPMHYTHETVGNVVNVTSIEFNSMKSFALEADMDINAIARTYIRELCLTSELKEQYSGAIPESSNPILVWE